MNRTLRRLLLQGYFTFSVFIFLRQSGKSFFTKTILFTSPKFHNYFRIISANRAPINLSITWLPVSQGRLLSTLFSSIFGKGEYSGVKGSKIQVSFIYSLYTV